MRCYTLSQILTLIPGWVNARRNPSLPIVLILAAFSTTTAFADAITYQYFGNNFNFITDGSPYSDSDYITASVTLASPPADNQDETVMTLLNWTISDQVISFSEVDPEVNSALLQFATTDGVITGWDFQVDYADYAYDIGTSNNGFVQDFSNTTFGQGLTLGDPGTWIEVAPEPSSIIAMALTGTILMLATRRKWRTRTPPEDDAINGNC